MTAQTCPRSQLAASARVLGSVPAAATADHRDSLRGAGPRTSSMPLPSRPARSHPPSWTSMVRCDFPSRRRSPAAAGTAGDFRGAPQAPRAGLRGQLQRGVEQLQRGGCCPSLRRARGRVRNGRRVLLAREAAEEFGQASDASGVLPSSSRALWACMSSTSRPPQLTGCPSRCTASSPWSARARRAVRAYWDLRLLGAGRQRGS